MNAEQNQAWDNISKIRILYLNGQVSDQEYEKGLDQGWQAVDDAPVTKINGSS